MQYTPHPSPVTTLSQPADPSVRFSNITGDDQAGLLRRHHTTSNLLQKKSEKEEGYERQRRRRLSHNTIDMKPRSRFPLADIFTHGQQSHRRNATQILFLKKNSEPKHTRRASQPFPQNDNRSNLPAAGKKQQPINVRRNRYDESIGEAGEQPIKRDPRQSGENSDEGPPPQEFDF
eukprot:UN23294